MQAAAGLQRHRHRQRPRPRRQRAVQRAAPPVQHRGAAGAGHGRGGGRHRRPPGRRSSAARSSCPRCRAALDEIRRVVTVFRELRAGRHRGRPDQAQVAERHAVHRRGDLGGHQRPGAGRALRRRACCAPADVAAGIVGAVVQGPGRRPRGLAGVPGDGRPGARRLARLLPRLPRASPDDASAASTAIRHHGPGSARSVRRGAGRLAPDVVLIEGPPEADALSRWPATPDMQPPVALLAYVPRTTRSTRGVLAVRGVLAGVAGDHARRWARASRSGSATCRPRISSPRGRGRPAPSRGAAADGGRADPRRAIRWPRRPGTTTPSAGGRTSSSTVADGGGRSTRSPRPCAEAMAEVRRRVRARPARPTPRTRPRGAHAQGAAPAASGRLRAGRRGLRRLARAGPDRAAAAGGRRRARCCAGCRRRKVTADLGAVDARPAGRRQRATAPGVTSPGWYHHLFTAPDQPVAAVAGRGRRRAARRGPAGVQRRTSSRRSGSPRRWPRCAAGRWPGWPRSPRPPGRCSATASDLRVRAGQRRLVVGERLGAVPADTPMVPLQRGPARLSSAACGCSPRR